MSSPATADLPVNKPKTRGKAVKKRKKVVISSGNAIGGELIVTESSVEVKGGKATSVDTSVRAINDVMAMAGITKITGGGATAQGAALFLNGETKEAEAAANVSGHNTAKPKPALEGGDATAATFEFTAECYDLGRPSVTAPKPCDDDINQIKKSLDVTNIRAGGAMAAGAKVESNVFASDEEEDEYEDETENEDQK